MKKLAIVGSGSETRSLAPFDDPEFDVWVFNEAGSSSWCKRWTACFQMHEPEIYQGHNTKDPAHWQWLKTKHNKRIYMQEIDPQVPDSMRYPLEDALELAGVKMFPTTFAYMAALAILEGYDEIRIFGVELSASEYQYQANGYLFWFGFLRGKLGAANVDSAVLYLNNNIFDVPLYGYEGNFFFGKDFFQSRAKQLDHDWGVYERDARIIKSKIEGVIKRGEIAKLPELVSQYQVALQNTGQAAGALAEAERYAAFGDRYADRGGFEFAAATAQRDGEAKRIMMFSKVGLIEYLGNVYMQTHNPEAAKKLIQQINEYGKLAEAYGAMLGMYRENISYILKYDGMVQANGGRIEQLEQMEIYDSA